MECLITLDLNFGHTAESKRIADRSWMRELEAISERGSNHIKKKEADEMVAVW